MTLQRVDGTLGLGLSVRGGAEHDLPLIISRLTPGTPAALCKQIFVGDAIYASKSLTLPDKQSFAHWQEMLVLHFIPGQTFFGESFSKGV